MLFEKLQIKMKKANLIFGRITMGIIILAVITIFSEGCSKNSSGPGANEVFIQGMAFGPATITVSAGTTITWTNKDAVGHTVTSTSGLFDSGLINANATYSHMFSAAGTYPYTCTIHPLMTGTVVVH
jgi:plastocyanin